MGKISYLLNYIQRSNDAFRIICSEEGKSLLSCWVDSVWCSVRYGSMIRQYSVGKFYKYSGCQRDKMMTTRRFFQIVKKANNPDYIKYLENKLLFNEYFKPFVQRKWYDSTSITLEQFRELVEAPSGAIIKPLDGMEGQGVYKLMGGAIDEEYKKVKGLHAIVEECLVQHPGMCFGNKSVNTIRVITVWDDKAQKAQLIKAVLRAGVGTAVVDNFHQGGCAYEVDIPTGYVCSKGISATKSDIIIHPGTDICMLGYKVPNWTAVVNGCLKAQSMLPQCRYISWDVAITTDGIELIEGNHNGDYDMLEFVGSTGYYEKIKKFIQ